MKEILGHTANEPAYYSYPCELRSACYICELCFRESPERNEHKKLGAERNHGDCVAANREEWPVDAMIYLNLAGQNARVIRVKQSSGSDVNVPGAPDMPSKVRAKSGHERLIHPRSAVLLTVQSA